MPTRSKAQEDHIERRQRLDRFAVDAERARNDYAEMNEAVDERTARLRHQRLKREAARPLNSKEAKQRLGKRVVRSRAHSKKTPQPDQSMLDHLFRPGQLVKITSDLYPRTRASGSYRIVSQLPADQSGTNLYRVRSDSEQHDRVVNEAQLSSANR
jgi:hypothetical protein